MTKTNYGVFPVPAERLVHMLGLPLGTRIVGARLDFFMNTNVEFVVVHTDLPEVREDERPQHVWPATLPGGEVVWRR